MEIKLNGKYKTKNGYKARLYASDGFTEAEIHGACYSETGKYWFPCCWSKEGEYVDNEGYMSITEVEEWKLVEDKEKRVVTANIYVFLFKDGSVIFSTTLIPIDNTDLFAKKIIEVSITACEGEGLE